MRVTAPVAIATLVLSSLAAPVVAGAHKPAILILWNRELSDETTTRFADDVSAKEDITAKKTVLGASNAPAHSEDSLQSKTTFQETSKRSLTKGTFTPLEPMMSSRLQTTFQGAWLATGVEVVDRNAIIRKMSTVATAAERADVQFLEATALDQGIDYLVEVLPGVSSPSPTGLTFQVKVIHLPSSTVVAQFLSVGQPPQGSPYWVTTSQGFEKRVDNRTTPETIGAELALETMGRLAH
jgi:hypothetical protein